MVEKVLLGHLSAVTRTLLARSCRGKGLPARASLPKRNDVVACVVAADRFHVDTRDPSSHHQLGSAFRRRAYFNREHPDHILPDLYDLNVSCTSMGTRYTVVEPHAVCISENVSDLKIDLDLYYQEGQNLERW